MNRGRHQMEREAFQPLRPRQHTNYEKIKDKKGMESVLAVLRSPQRLEQGTIKRIHNETKIPLDTLKTWRKKLILDPNATLFVHGAPGVAHVLDEDLERQIYEKIQNEYIFKKRYCPIIALQRIAKSVVGDLVPNFKANRTWAQYFMKRWGLSLRTPHVKRRTSPNDEIIAKFISDFEVALMQFPKNLIFNMDESSWRLVNGKLRTVSRRGSDEVVILSNSDLKETLTVIATINAIGEKLPIIIIAKGKTKKSEEKYRTDIRLRKYISNGELFIMHSPSGWATADLMREYLKFISRKIGKRNAYLLWDLHASHRDESVREYSAKRNIQLSYIPAGQTGEWQPLDRRIFGNLKNICHAEFQRLALIKTMEELDIVDAIVILLDAWHQISNQTIQHSWNHLIDESIGNQFPE